ncbi:Pkinase-domain-containing protein, partial [Roridomyces roridus]
MAPHAYDVAEIPPPRHAQSKPKRVNRILGDYTLSKTLGAGSMGKVKLATHNGTGEKFAVKILPRARPTTPGTKEATKEAGKEIRTLREAGLSLLLHHPYICGMREMIVHPNHYYMVFDYVNGGQLLDFIIAHGRLRERIARKFARQIASALDYCHRNNVVHRDLKIENILISQTGNIKIIDFGLSNLYNPASLLTTFCGSLYFAAPELLNAKLYTGPEVDIWSFGVVLYTLLCGKVPFEDESMPVLHAKIKRGLVEYPVWLSAECKHLLTRMLVTSPSRRAPLSEILSHPWMTRGFSRPPMNHLPTRVPLRTQDLDPAVVERMAGFDFGSDVEEVMERLRDILESDDYAAAVLAYEHRANGHADEEPAPPPPSPSPIDTAKRRRFSGIDLYRRIFSATPTPQSPTASAPPPAPSPRDPTGGFHPLLSMYFLAREKLEREKVFGGADVFASSQVSLAVVPDSPAPKEEARPFEEMEAQARRGVEPEPGSEVEVAEAAVEIPAIVSASAPEPSHVPGREPAANGHHVDLQQPREKLVIDTATPANMVSEVTVHSPVAQAEAVEPEPEPEPAVIPPPPSTQPDPVVDEQGRLLVEKENKPDAAESESATKPQGDSPSKQPRARRRDTQSGGTTLLRKFGSMLLGKHDGEVTGTVKKRDVSKRMSVVYTPPATATAPAPVSAPVPVEKAEEKEKEPVVEVAAVTLEKEAAPEPAPESSVAPEPSSPSIAKKGSQRFGSVRRRAATILDSSTRTTGHERRPSTSGAGGTIGRNRRTSMVGYDSATMRKADRMPEPVPESERTEELSEGALDGHGDSENERYPEQKPVFLKGLFSVSTTSTKPPPIIKADIRRVLDRMQVRYWQNKSGFECVHVPSIDASALEASSPPPPQSPSPPGSHAFPSSGETTVEPPPTPTITKRVSRLSFSVRRMKSSDQYDFTTVKARRASRPLSMMVPNGAQQPLVVPVPDAASVQTIAKPASVISGSSKLLSSMASDLQHAPPTSPLDDPHASGELDRQAFESMSHNALSVRFEINIVKVPLLPLHGIQFRRSGGDGWQYQMLARRVLTEL